MNNNFRKELHIMFCKNCGKEIDNLAAVCIHCGVAVGNAAPAAIGATSEDPKAFGKAIIFVALGEGIALYGVLVSMLIINS